MTLWAELKRRNVIRAGLAWLALSWLLIAIADLLFPYLGLPEEAIRGLILGLAIALLPVLVLAWMLELTTRGLRWDRGPQGDNPENVRTARRIDQLTLVLVLAALAISGVREFALTEDLQTPEADAVVEEASPPGPGGSPPPALPPAPPGPVDPRSVAVLPFANMSPNPNNAFLAEGLAEELLNILARIEGLKVASRTSSFSLHDEAIGAREIGRRLGVAYVLDGSVRRQQGDIRIGAQLVRAADDAHIWSGTFDQELTDIFQVQERIAQAIADALVEPLGVRSVEVRRPTDDLQAYELFLRGRQLFAQRGASLIPARELLREAVERDPGFAEAWALLAGAEYVLPSYSSEIDTGESRENAMAAAAMALDITPDEPNALAVSSRLAADRGNRSLALELADKALNEDANSANTWMWQGLTLLEAGHIDAARKRFERARALDPLSGIHYGWLGATELIDGDLDAAERHLERARSLGWQGPASAWLLKLALLRHGPGKEAASRFDDWLRLDGRITGEMRTIYQAIRPALESASKRPAAEDALAIASRDMPGVDWTHGYLFAGLPEQAAREALRPKPPSNQLVLMMAWSPVDRAFREHPGFIDYARRHGLVEFWAAHGWPDNCRPVGEPPERLECER